VPITSPTERLAVQMQDNYCSVSSLLPPLPIITALFVFEITIHEAPMAQLIDIYILRSRDN
jgi:hypothetical protein